MLIDRVQPALGRQIRKDTHLRGDHTVGSNRQVMFRFQVDKAVSIRRRPQGIYPTQVAGAAWYQRRSSPGFSLNILMSSIRVSMPKSVNAMTPSSPTP